MHLLLEILHIWLACAVCKNETHPVKKNKKKNDQDKTKVFQRIQLKKDQAFGTMFFGEVNAK